MTQTNTQSVRSDAEAAVNTNRVPTFEEVYAMPYVQDSIRALIDQNVRQYPILASHEDDLRQELLISIWKELPRFDSTKASIKTYLRMVLHSSMKMARREYLSETNLSLAYADNIEDYEICDENSSVSKENRQTMATLAHTPLESEILRRDVACILDSLPEMLRSVAYRLMDGESVRQIALSMGVDHKTVTSRYIKPLRRAFKNFF